MGIGNSSFLQCELGRIIPPTRRRSNLVDGDPDFSDPVHELIRWCGDNTNSRGARSVFGVSFILVGIR